MGLRTTSDHAWVTCNATLTKDDGKGYNWSLNSALLQDTIATATIQSEIKQYFDLNADCRVPQSVVWDAFKAVIRGQWIAVASAYKKEKELTIRDLKDKIKTLEDRLLKFGGAKTLRKLNVARKLLELYETSKIQQNILYLKQRYVTKMSQSLR